MHTTLLLPLLLALPAQAKRPETPAIPKVPSIEDVVAAEGFTPTPSQSEIYQPGAVLVPNGRGGHDVVLEHCVEAEPSIAIMSQSSIATTLAGGVSARLGMARGSAHADVEKRLSFVDPEQRTIPLASLRPTDACAAGVQTAGVLQDLSEAIVLHDVLVAIIKNTVCTKADASGGMVAIGEVEAAAFSECVQESDGQVPLGYKAVPLAKVLSLAGGSIPAASSAPATPATPASAQGSADFSSIGGALDVESRLKEKACSKQAEDRGAEARMARLQATAVEVRDAATASWKQIEGPLTSCVQLPRAERDDCIHAAEQWLESAREMTVELPAGVERVETDCGQREEAFPADRRSVDAREGSAAQALLKQLKQSGTAAACDRPTSLTCTDVMQLVGLEVPTAIIIGTMNGASGCFPAEVISCMKENGAPGAIISAAKNKR